MTKNCGEVIPGIQQGPIGADVESTYYINTGYKAFPPGPPQGKPLAEGMAHIAVGNDALLHSPICSVPVLYIHCKVYNIAAAGT